MAADYTKADIASCLAGLPLSAGDVVFSHSNAGFFGRMDGARSGAEICAALAEAILARIAPGGTIVVPTFTYSFPSKEVFDVQNTGSKMGAFAEWLRRHPERAPLSRSLLFGRGARRAGGRDDR